MASNGILRYFKPIKKIKKEEAFTSVHADPEGVPLTKPITLEYFMGRDNRMMKKVMRTRTLQDKDGDWVTEKYFDYVPATDNEPPLRIPRNQELPSLPNYRPIAGSRNTYFDRDGNMVSRVLTTDFGPNHMEMSRGWDYIPIPHTGIYPHLPPGNYPHGNLFANQQLEYDYSQLHSGSGVMPQNYYMQPLHVFYPFY